MEWDRSMTIGLAKVGCTYCHGYGLRFARNGHEVPCHCVFRAVFRACYNRFAECIANGPHTSAVTLEFCRGTERRRAYSRKREEFMADFCLVSRRMLRDSEHRIFRFHYLLGADWRLCCQRLQMDRGTFFHMIYRIQQKLGRAFAEIQPYALFPIDEYFSGVVPRDPNYVRPIPTAAPVPKRPSLLPLSA